MSLPIDDTCRTDAALVGAAAVPQQNLNVTNYNTNTNNHNNFQDLLNIIQKLNSREISPDALTTEQRNLVINLNANLSQCNDANIAPFTSQAQSQRGVLSFPSDVHNNVLLRQTKEHDQRTVTSSTKHSLSSSSLPQNKAFKKVRHQEKEAHNNITHVHVPLTAAECKATFPLPLKSGNQGRVPTIKLSETSSLQTMWDKFEMITDDMDDTIADQEAFVKRLFISSLHRPSLNHLTERSKKQPSLFQFNSFKAHNNARK
jgi:hypothetical protein